MVFKLSFFITKFCNIYTNYCRINFHSISMRSYLFYKMFVPSGVPTLLIPFLIVIEIISHIAKIFSLAIRLFANIMSGHILLHILTGFVFKIGKFNLLVTLIPVIILILVFFLEYAVTLLQAYVLITLVAIYFEEHFGFTQEDKINSSKLISVNGRQSYVFKQLFTLSILIQLRKRIQRYFNCGTYMNNRRKGRLRRFRKFWDYTVIAHSAITRKV